MQGIRQASGVQRRQAMLTHKRYSLLENPLLGHLNFWRHSIISLKG